jgi:hypothetical protein
MDLRLRQVAMVGDEYDVTEQALRQVFGLGVAYRDPGTRPGREAGVSIFGLKNFVMPIGNQFLELVTPLKPGPESAGGRYIARRQGAGGYMLLFQVTRSDYELHREHLENQGVRLVAGGEISESDSDALHIHPKDLPGCLVELRWCENEDVADGDWWPVERDWKDHRNTEIIEAIVGAEIQTPEPGRLAAQWADRLQQTLDQNHDNPTILTADGPIRFVVPSDGRPEGLGGIDVKASDPVSLLRSAEEFGLRCEGHTIEVCGLRFNVVS